MSSKLILFGLVSFLHDLFTVIWMGGLIVTVLAYMPAVKSAIGGTPQAKKVLAAFQKRQSTWVYISIAGLLLTGLAMAKRSPSFENLFGFGTPYMIILSIKHALVVLMIGISIYRSILIGREKGPAATQKEALSAKLVITNAGLAILVLLASGFLAALA